MTFILKNYHTFFFAVIPTSKVQGAFVMVVFSAAGKQLKKLVAASASHLTIQ